MVSSIAAVASSLVPSQRVMSPAPTSTCAAVCATTVTGCEVELLRPPLSVTLRLAVYVPPAAQVCAGFWVLAVAPSPKLQLHATTLPSGSLLVLVNAQASTSSDPDGSVVAWSW